MKDNKDNLFLNLLFNIVVPSLILMKLSDSKYLGPVKGLILALSFPLIFGIYSLIKNRKVIFSQLLELTYNWGDTEDYGSARNFGHIAVGVDNIYDTCTKLQDMGVTINRPPRDGHMAFIKTPDNISVELIQNGNSLDKTEPWLSMENIGGW